MKRNVSIVITNIVLLLLSNTVVFSQYAGGFGGIADHWVSPAITNNCSPAYTNVSLGGSADGHTLAMVNYINCNPNSPYLGGTGGTQNLSAGTFANCSPAYTNVSLGGIADGHTLAIVNYVNCNANIPYLGGTGGDQNGSAGTFANCTPAYTNVSLGGSADGHTLATVNYINCNTNIPYLGGTGGTQNLSAGTFANCTPAYTNVSLGGIADGHTLDAPVACFTVTPVCTVVAPNAGNDITICNGQNTQLSASGGNTYAWLPTTGLNNPNIYNPVATPTVVGSISYTVTVSDGFCSLTDVVVVTVNPTPAPAITANPSLTICNGQSTTLNATTAGAVLYLWSPTTYLNNPNIAAPVATPTVVGSISYSVTVTNTYNCTAVVSATVTVNPTPVASISGVLSICAGSSATLTASGGGTYLWSTASTATTIIVTPTSNTTYSVTATNASGCSNTAYAAVVVNQYPVASITGNPTTICSGQTSTLTASGGGTYLWSTASTAATITVTPAITTGYAVTVTSAGCSSVATITVTVVPAIASISGTNTICSGQSSVLTANSAVSPTSYLWSTTETTQGITVSPTNPPSSSYIYSVTLTYASCSPSSATSTVTVNPLPAAAVGSNKSICYGASTTIGAAAVGGSTYNWTSSPAGFTSASANPTVNPTTTTIYTLTQIITSTGCQNSNTVTVTVYPQVTLTGGGNICSGNPNTLFAYGGSGVSPVYAWSSTPAGAYPATSSIIVNPTATTTYTVSITDTYCTASATATVTVLASCTYANVSLGGASDGHTLASVNYVNCNPSIPYLGGTGGTQYLSAGTFANCTPAYTNVSLGGIADGHTFAMMNYVNCNTSIPYLGGTGGTQNVSAGTFANCTPAYTNVSLGGSADGHTFAMMNYVNCNTSIPYLGGTGGYQNLSAGTFANCTPAYTNVSLGGVADGHSYQQPALCLIVVPIELLSFTAALLPDRTVQCNWITASEINNDYFTVERAITPSLLSGGLGFSSIGTVKGAGNSNTTLSYSLIDKEPFVGTSYYRLKQTDYDGTFYYSQIVPIYRGDAINGITVNLYPNPATELLNVFFAGAQKMNISIHIYDIFGRKMYGKNVSADKGSNHYSINTSALSEGMYFLSIINTVTNEPLSVKRFEIIK